MMNKKNSKNVIEYWYSESYRNKANRENKASEISD